MSLKRFIFPLSALCSAVVFSFPAAAQEGQTPPSPAVTVEAIQPRNVPVTYEYPARVAASREVEVRARVGGILLQRSFEEGAVVTAGDRLFAIDSRPYEAEAARARAQVQQANAQLAQARRTEERTRTLSRSGSTSTATLDDAVSQRQLAEATLAQAEAQLVTVNLSLDYATVQAPVSGITSLEQVPEGSLLSTGDLLTKITQLDPVYVNFSAADTEAAAIRDRLASGSLSEGMNNVSVKVKFGNGTVYDQAGTIDFTSSSIDQQTGTILSRAVLPNPSARLLPGQFVRVALEGLVVENAITIPAEALMQGPQGTFVYTIDDKNVAAVRPVQVGRDLGDRLLIASGLNAGDKVISKGVIKVRPGAPVAPTEAPAPAEADVPAAAAEASQQLDIQTGLQSSAGTGSVQ